MIQYLFSNKKNRILSRIIIILFMIYLFALLQPGIWFRGVFLYQQRDGSFIGSDSYGRYKMSIEKKDKGADISFLVNDIINQYKIVNNTSTDIQVYENNALVFYGEAIDLGTYILKDKNGAMPQDNKIVIGNTVSKTEELFPTYSQLYTWSVLGKDIRGNLSAFAVVLLLSICLILDIVFPNLFFILKYRLAVDGGEPSDIYRIGQVIGRFAIGIGIIIFIVLSFIIH